MDNLLYRDTVTHTINHIYDIEVASRVAFGKCECERFKWTCSSLNKFVFKTRTTSFSTYLKLNEQAMVQLVDLSCIINTIDEAIGTRSTFSY